MKNDKDKTPKKAICITGMHRSGTSAVACAISLLGVYFGKPNDMMTPLPENPMGFWERADLVSLHDRIYHRLKREWDTVIPLPKQWHRLAKMRVTWLELLNFVKREFLEHPIWGWKDPRTALLLDVWKDLLNDLDVELFCLLVVRSPLDVALSLSRRDGFSYEKSFGIWLNYYISALNSSKDIPKAFISYDSLVDNCESTIKKCAKKLEIQWPEEDTKLKKELKRFILPKLNHSNASNDLPHSISIPKPTVKLYELLECVSRTDKNPDDAFYNDVDKIAQDFFSYSSAFQENIDQLWDCKKHLHEQKKRIETIERQLNALAMSENQFKRFDYKFTALYNSIKKMEQLIKQRS